MKRERTTKCTLLRAILVWPGDLPTRAAPPGSARPRTALVRQRRAPAPPAVQGRAVLAPIEAAVVIVCWSWDRGTERVERLGSMAAAYAKYFASRREADRRHVLFVLPTDAREREVQRVLGRALDRPGGTCRIWTANAGTLRTEGPLGPAWLEARGSDARRPLNAMPAAVRPELAVADCIGKPKWWERRPAGGEGA